MWFDLRAGSVSYTCLINTYCLAFFSILVVFCALRFRLVNYQLRYLRGNLTHLGSFHNDANQWNCVSKEMWITSWITWIRFGLCVHTNLRLFDHPGSNCAWRNHLELVCWSCVARLFSFPIVRTQMAEVTSVTHHGLTHILLKDKLVPRAYVI